MTTTGGRATDHGPTLGEVVRRLEDVTRQLSELGQRLDSTYVRKETYAVQHIADTQVAVDLRRDLDAIVEQQRANRRLALSGIVLPVLATIIAALILALVLPR